METCTARFSILLLLLLVGSSVVAQPSDPPCLPTEGCTSWSAGFQTIGPGNSNCGCDVTFDFRWRQCGIALDQCEFELLGYTVNSGTCDEKALINCIVDYLLRHSTILPCMQVPNGQCRTTNTVAMASCFTRQPGYPVRYEPCEAEACCVSVYEICKVQVNGQWVRTYTRVSNTTPIGCSTEDCYPVCGYIPGEPFSKPEFRLDVEGPEITVVPNPANAVATVTTAWPDVEGDPLLVIFDVDGNQRETLRGTAAHGQATFSVETTGWASGLYAFGVYSDVRPMVKGSIVVAR